MFVGVGLATPAGRKANGRELSGRIGLGQIGRNVLLLPLFCNERPAAAGSES
jgi:hypothetical protein